MTPEELAFMRSLGWEDNGDDAGGMIATARKLNFAFALVANPVDLHQVMSWRGLKQVVIPPHLMVSFANFWINHPVPGGLTEEEVATFKARQPPSKAAKKIGTPIPQKLTQGGGTTTENVNNSTHLSCSFHSELEFSDSESQ